VLTTGVQRGVGESGDPTVGPRTKFWTKVRRNKKWHAGEAQTQDVLYEKDPAVDDCGARD